MALKDTQRFCLIILCLVHGIYSADIEMKVVLFNNVEHYMTAGEFNADASCTVRHRVEIRELWMKYHSTYTSTIDSCYMTWHVWFVTTILTSLPSLFALFIQELWLPHKKPV